ncbi:hypothetical protein UFOVP787_113 [uncultured Caudovirales phage]|uniref:Uncharacterized protein n=1 Tax=uncultured Caudovirales phage TaxID=2100421 RepID=A0A6J5NTL0_9CAUD|nr:hypothetical protein UFOVP787_113 [uncultured Caudovirales phage]
MIDDSGQSGAKEAKDTPNSNNSIISNSSAHKEPYALEYLKDISSGASTTKYFEGPLNNRSVYGDTPFMKEGQGKPAIETSRKKYAPNADKPTTAAADNGTDINKAKQQVDPFGTAQVFMNMINQFNQIRSTMASAPNTNPNQPSCAELLQLAFYGALCLLSNKYTFNKVITVFSKTFITNSFSTIDVKYQALVKQSLLKLIQDAIRYGENNIPVSVLPVLVYGERVPSPLITTVPDLYCQVYYTTNMDPYPGYIQWKSQNNDIVYSRRTETQLPYESPDQEMVMISERIIAAFLDPYVKNEILTTDVLNLILSQEDSILKTSGIEKNVGKNGSSSDNLLSFLGALGTAVNFAQTVHLPNSVLNTSKINEAMSKFTQGMSMLKVMKNQSIPSLDQMNSLSGINVPSDLLSSVGIPSGISNIPVAALSSFGITNEVINQIGSTVIGDAMNAANITASVIDQTKNLIKVIGV